MSIMAVAIPITPGKTPAWRRWADELNGERQQEFAASRQRLAVRERTFLQQTPRGDLVIVTLEGADPEGAFRQMMNATDSFSAWFLDHVRELHGVDPASMESTPAPTLVVDSAAVPVPAG